MKKNFVCIAAAALIFVCCLAAAAERFRECIQNSG
jgi:hypothetical protein